MPNKSTPNDPYQAFCKDSEAFLEGKSGGPLSPLTFAAKDIFDVKDYVTGGGNPDWKATHLPAKSTAWAIRALVEAGATMVGKTLTDELTRGIFGENKHYGAPINPRAPACVTGGSSSGSASAVAGKLVDFALGSDTLGSVRIPASYCGLYGLRPTHGRIPLDGFMIQAPSYDTIGWFARDADTFAQVGSVLLGHPIPDVLPRRLLIAEDAFELAEDSIREVLEPLVKAMAREISTVEPIRLSNTSLADWLDQQSILQGSEAWDSVADWVDQTNPRLSFRVAERYLAARRINDQQRARARKERETIRKRLSSLLTAHSVICLPTTPITAPPLGERLSIRRISQVPIFSLVTIASTAGIPQISLPLAEVDGKPAGISLIGAKGSDEALIGAGRALARLLS